MPSSDPFKRRAVLALLFSVAADVAPCAGATPERVADFEKIVVIVQENHSFDNLFGKWGDVGGQPVNDLRFAASAAPQIRADATPYECLPQNDVNLTAPAPLPVLCVEKSVAGAPLPGAFPNRPFEIDAFIVPTDTTCPPPGERPPKDGVAKGKGLPGGCTRDMAHRFYAEQFQINGGRQDRFVTGGDAMGLVMGYYDTTKLPIYRYLHAPGAPHYVVADNFFHAAFGGSFINHQWLIAAATPVFEQADNSGGAHDLHAVVDENGMGANTPLYASPLGKMAQEYALTASCAPPPGRPAPPPGVACGDFAVGTIQPSNEPIKPGTPPWQRLPALAHETIGDRLDDAHIDWAWYAGGWSNADGRVGAPGWTNPPTHCDPATTMAGAVFPRCPDMMFQFHHQPFVYFGKYAPGTDARKERLLDETEFLAAAAQGGLRPVSFVKALGSENEHPGDASESRGDQHLVDLVEAVVKGPDANRTLIVVIYDEFGGAWDHIAPPPWNADKSAPSDKWGPGARVPALLISARFTRSGVDKAAHDTTSVTKLIEERFGLAPLSARDAAVRSLSSAISVAY